jgi:hypothetical protein
MINYLTTKRAESFEQRMRDWLEFLEAGDVALEPQEYARIEKLFAPALKAEFLVTQRQTLNNFAKRALRAALETETANNQPAKVLPFRILSDPQNEDNQIA